MNPRAIATRAPHNTASAYWQQRLTSWDPVFTPFSVISMLVIIGIVFLPIGVTMLFGANSLYTQAIQYGGVGTEATLLTDCTDGCDLNFTIDMNIDGPLYLYYEITNYYQNNIKYSSSVNWNQMMGKTDVSQSDLGTSCDPATTITDNANSALTLNPCGLIAKSYFTDAFSASVPSGSSGFDQVEMSTDEITGPLDQSLFQQPQGFKSASYSGSACSTATDFYTLTAAQCAADLGTPSCKCYFDTSTTPGKWYVFYYPDDDTTQYLYETYVGLVSPLEGVTDPRFMNWMNIAALPKFRKLYGKMEGTYKQGDQIKITVSYPTGISGTGTGYDVDQFKGTKSVILSARGALGVKNRGLGVTYIVSGACMIVMALVFFVKHEVSPRSLGSAALLNWTR